MKNAYILVSLLAVATLAPRPAAAQCADPSTDAALATASKLGAVLVPVGPHPILDRTLAGGANTLASLVTSTLEVDKTTTLLGQVSSTPIPVRLDNDDFAAFIAQQDGLVTRIDPQSLETAPGWPVDLRSGLDCGSDAITATPAVHLRRFATPGFKAAYSTDLVYVATRYGCGNTTGNRIYALNAETGAIEWAFNLTGSVAMDAVLADPFLDIEHDRLYVATDRNDPTQDSLWAIDLLTGNKAWSVNVGRLWTAPVVRGDRIYVVTLFGEMKALSVADGTVIWSLPNPMGAPVTSNMFTEFRAPYGGLMIVIDVTGALWAVLDDTVHGTTQWTATLPSGAASRVAIDPDHGKVYVGGRDSKIYQLNIVNGSIEASRDVTGGQTDSAVVGVPTLVFENTDGSGGFDALRLVAGSNSGHVSKFCVPWTAEEALFSPVAGPGPGPIFGPAPPNKICKTAADCGATPPNQCTVWACKDQVCVAAPVANGKSCDDGNLATTGDRCQAGTCAGRSDCDLRLDSCKCKNDDGVGIVRTLLNKEPAECPRPPKGFPADWCGTQIVTLDALNQCVNHDSNAASIVTVRLFDQESRPFTKAEVTMTITGGGGDPPQWIVNGKAITDPEVSTANGGVIESERAGTYFALLTGQKGGAPTQNEPYAISVDVRKTADETTCIDTTETPIPPVLIEMGGEDLVCPLDSNSDQTGYMRIQVVDSRGDPVEGAPVIAGYAGLLKFHNKYEKFLLDPGSPNLSNLQETDSGGFVEFFDFGNNMNPPMDVSIEGRRFCITEAETVINLDDTAVSCRELRKQ